MKKRKFNPNLILVLAMILIFSQYFRTDSLAVKPIRLVVDGNDITSLASPIIENGRTLVPIRFIIEELGGKVDWDGKKRIVTIEKDDLLLCLKIDSHLVQYQDSENRYALIDVTPKIIDNRTFVPLRLVSNALGIGIEWDEENRVIYVDSNKTSTVEPFFNTKISTLDSGQVISGKTDLQIENFEDIPQNAKEIKYILIEPGTSEGFVIARGNNLRDKYTWFPDLEDKGEKVLVAAIYDERGRFLAGDAISVYLNIAPKVFLTGVSQGETLGNTINLGTDVNFQAYYVKYEIINLDTGETKIIGEETPQDPYGLYKWEPKVNESGNYYFKSIAYDGNDKPYESETIFANVQVEPKLSLIGVSDGQTINKPVNLSAFRNFDVIETQFILRDPNTGEEEIIATIPYGSHKWFPGPEFSGKREVLVRVRDTKGIYHESKAKSVNLSGKPIVLVKGVGPNQVLTGSAKLQIDSNVNLDSINYIFTNKNTGKQKTIAANKGPLFEQTYTPTKEDGGYWTLKAIGKYNGKEISSEQVPIRVYLGKIYKPVPIIEKDKFLDLASGLAKDSWEKTGMSASLQTAQSILETGWGQSVPVDKYSGKLSYNLFGIKGKGPQGSVTINTWEVYNGQKYNIDADFRAYNNVGESWADHKEFLLDKNKSRYEPFREVMHNSVQGAWALKRTGYATDPEYAKKLNRIIKQYNLKKLDKISI